MHSIVSIDMCVSMMWSDSDSKGWCARYRVRDGTAELLLCADELLDMKRVYVHHVIEPVDGIVHSHLPSADPL